MGREEGQGGELRQIETIWDCKIAPPTHARAQLCLASCSSGRCLACLAPWRRRRASSASPLRMQAVSAGDSGGRPRPGWTAWWGRGRREWGRAAAATWPALQQPAGAVHRSPPLSSLSPPPCLVVPHAVVHAPHSLIGEQVKCLGHLGGGVGGFASRSWCLTRRTLNRCSSTRSSRATAPSRPKHTCWNLCATAAACSGLAPATLSGW